MSTEAAPKRENYTAWIISSVLLLLLAAGIPLAVNHFGPRKIAVDISGGAGGQIVWRFHSDGVTQTGVTNLPVRLVFRAGEMEFTAQRTNSTGRLEMDVSVNGSFEGSADERPGGGFRLVQWWGCRHRWALSAN